MRLFIGLLLMALTVPIASAYAPSDSAKVYFRQGYRTLDMSFKDNRNQIESFAEAVRSARKADDIDHIEVRAYASPDGQHEANRILTVNRCNELARYITENLGIDKSLVTQMPEGIAWDELRRMVAENHDVPGQKKVLDILDNTPVWIYNSSGKIVGGRKSRLMMVEKGNSYRWMMQHLFPSLRSAVAVSLYLKSDRILENKASEQTAADEAVAEVVEVLTEPNDAEEGNTAEMTKQNVSVNGSGEMELESDIITVMGEPEHRCAIGTNIVYDALLVPNLEFHWRVNHDWSLLLEGDVAWWKKSNRHRYYRIAMVSPEVRRWFKVRKPWHGMYMGLFAGIGKYDFENGHTGYMGNNAFFAGASFGYMFPISRYFSFDATIGVGYLNSRFKEYVPFEGHYIYKRTRTFHYGGPLKVRFSLIWRFWDTNKKKIYKEK